MFAKISRATGKFEDFVWNKTYPANAIKKSVAKNHHGLLRGTFFRMLTTCSAIFAGATVSGIGSTYASMGGAILGGIIGSVIPGPGTVIGATVGAFIGWCVGALIGWKVGVELGGFLAATITKHVARLVSAIFNLNEKNHTNPYKYKLTKEEAKDPSITTSSEQVDEQSRLTAINTISYEKAINQKLATCYEFKKQIKSNPILRALGVNHFFWNDKQKHLNSTINSTAEVLKSGIYDLADKARVFAELEELMQTSAETAGQGLKL